MIFRDGFYHADPHPGNIFLMPDGRLGMIDCGMVGRLDEALRDNMEQLLVAIVHQDSPQLTRLIMRLCSVPRSVDPAALTADVSDFLSFYASQSLAQLQLGTALTEMTDVIRRHQLLMPGRVSLLIKVLVMLEGTSRLMNPTFNLIELIVPFQKRLMRRRLSLKPQCRAEDASGCFSTGCISRRNYPEDASRRCWTNCAKGNWTCISNTVACSRR